jgi:tRNA pseudouridine 55 synthase
MTLCGWINLYKPVGYSSFDLVKQVRRLFPRGTKVGHGGTLDPLAQGVLPIAVGEATKTVAYLMDDVKGYQFEVTWGEERETDDLEGKVVHTSAERPSIERINQSLPHFTGPIQQVPPLYSAKKIAGKRACDRIRQGEQDITLAATAVEIYRLQLIAHQDDKAVFKVDCSKGTYVRSLARDLGRQLGCYGFASKITRTKVGQMTLDTAVTIEKLAVCEKNVIVTKIMRPLQAVLADIPAVLVTLDQEARLRQGQAVVLDPGFLVQHEAIHKQSYVLCYNAEQNPIAMGCIDGGVIQPKRIFNV